MNFKLCLQLFLLLASVAPHMVSARDLFHTHESSRFPIPQHLQGSRKGHNIEGINTVKTYLQRYGYLRNNVERNNANVFDENLELALKTYQKFFNLNVSGVLDAETLAVMAMRRCGVPDVFNNEGNMTKAGEDDRNHPHIGALYTFFSGEPKWPDTKYNLKYSFINNFPENYKKPVNEAIARWDGATGFKFQQVDDDADDEDDCDIYISFEYGDHGDGFPFEPAVLAHAFAPEDGRLHFNGAVPWFYGASEDKYGVYSVALHEMGHILGLEHSKAHDSIMHPTIAANTVKSLENDDVEELVDLYRGWIGD